MYAYKYVVESSEIQNINYKPEEIERCVTCSKKIAAVLDRTAPQRFSLFHI